MWVKHMALTTPLIALVLLNILQVHNTTSAPCSIGSTLQPL